MPISNSKRVSTKGLARSPEMKGRSQAEKFLWRVQVQSCKRRSIGCAITADEFLKLTQRPCHYCGAPPNNLVPVSALPRLLANGVDRACNEEGYTRTNSVPCCKLCNSMKSALSAKGFLTHVERIAAFQKV